MPIGYYLGNSFLMNEVPCPTEETLKTMERSSTSARNSNRAQVMRRVPGTRRITCSNKKGRN
jgi:hypothetical protein